MDLGSPVEGPIMGKKFRDYSPDQDYLFPPSPRDWLPDDHLVHFVLDVVRNLDLSRIYSEYRQVRGAPPYEPMMMVGVWLYAFCMGIRSSRRVERALHEDLAFRYLSGNQRPDHWTLSEFRRRHMEALSQLFQQTVKLAATADLVKLGQVAFDGSKIKANASKHCAMSYRRMVEEEARIQGEINLFFQEADAVDKEEDELHGQRRGDELPEHLQNSTKRLRTIQEAKRALEEEARERARTKQDQRRKEAEAEDREFQPRVDPDEAVPSPKSQRNFTDPESRIMGKPGKSYEQAYNAQAGVDVDSQIIVAADLTNMAADAPHLPALLSQVEKNRVPTKVGAKPG
jgi:transposase